MVVVLVRSGAPIAEVEVTVTFGYVTVYPADFTASTLAPLSTEKYLIVAVPVSTIGPV